LPLGGGTPRLARASVLLLVRAAPVAYDPRAMNPLIPVALGTFFLNLPFGFWRGGVRKFSLPWFLAVHAPVPVVAGMRYLAGVHWSFTTFPFLVGAYFGGQLLGARWRRWRMRAT
jgi:hypothetical protein